MVRYYLALAALSLSFIACKDTKPATTVTQTQPDPAPSATPTRTYFEDVTARTGITVRYENGEERKHYSILESLGGGVAIIDYDRDGKLDLFFPGGGGYEGPDGAAYKKQLDEFAEKKRRDAKAEPPPPPKIHGRPARLFRNLGEWKFEEVTKKAGLETQPDVFTHGAAVADYDCDGYQDLLVTGYGRVTLYHNEENPQGGRRFVDVTESAGLKSPHFWSTSAAFGDLDGDGFPDLYICQYVDWSWANDPLCPGYSIAFPRDVCPPKQYNSVQHALYRNTGKGGFEDVTKAAGIRSSPREDKDYGKGLGVMLVDGNGDGKLDIYVANDTTDNFLYINQSVPGKLQFEDRGFAMGVAKDNSGNANGSMGVWAGDFDGSGRPSIWVTNYENEYHALYRSIVVRDRVNYVFHTPAAGLTVIGPNFVGFGTAFVDFDLDGWEDIVITNGHVVHHPPRKNLLQKAILFHNRRYETEGGPPRRFFDATKQGGSYFANDHRGRGLAIGDLDNDGVADLVFANVNEPAAIVRGIPGDHHWLGVELVPTGNRSPVGAKLVLDLGDRKLSRFIIGGGSYLSAHDLRKVFGLGTYEKPGKLTVTWPNGAEQSWDGLAIDRYHRLEQN
jgi:hypothetical protein